MKLLTRILMNSTSCGLLILSLINIFTYQFMPRSKVIALLAGTKSVGCKKMHDIFSVLREVREGGASSRSPTFAVIIAVTAPRRGYAIV